MKRSRYSIIFILPLITLVCVSLLFLADSPINIPGKATKIFGPPSDSLSLIDKIYASAQVTLHTEDLTSPSNPFGVDVPFQVALGESPILVSNRLKDVGLIKNPVSFRNYLVYSGLDTQIQAGDFVLSPAMTPIEIAWALQDSSPTHVDLAILPGWRVEEIAAQITLFGLGFTPDDFIAIVHKNKAEGHLLPGIYSLPRDITAELMVRTFVDAFDVALTPELETGFTQQGLSTQDAIKLASIVERESVIDDEMPLIASVFINRLKIGMKLDADPTVQYALGYNSMQGTWWTNPLSRTDLEVDSTYNTYLYSGLPPTPICNPGTNALRAVAFSAKTPYYYFRAACNNSGQHLFAETLEDHIGNECP
jgi:UPF0755 protein